MSESHWWYINHKEVKSWGSTTGFRIWHFQTPSQKQYLQMHLLALQFVFFFFWVMIGIKDNVSALLTDEPVGVSVVETCEWNGVQGITVLVSQIGGDRRLLRRRAGAQRGTHEGRASDSTWSEAFVGRVTYFDLPWRRMKSIDQL